MKKQVVVLAFIVAAVSTFASQAAQEIKTKAQFDKITVQSDKPVVLYIYGARCPHCKRFTPKFENVANQLQGDYTFVKAEAGTELSGAFSVRGVPYIALVKNGKKVANKSGFGSENEFKSFLTSHNG